VHIHFLIGFANRLFVLLQWGFDFLTKTSSSASLVRRTSIGAEFDRSSSLIFTEALPALPGLPD